MEAQYYKSILFNDNINNIKFHDLKTLRHISPLRLPNQIKLLSKTVFYKEVVYNKEFFQSANITNIKELPVVVLLSV